MALLSTYNMVVGWLIVVMCAAKLCVVNLWQVNFLCQETKCFQKQSAKGGNIAEVTAARYTGRVLVQDLLVPLNLFTFLVWRTATVCEHAFIIIIPVRRLTEWVVTEGWRAKQMVLGKQRKKTAKTLSLFLKWVQLTHRSVPCGNKTLHTFHLWNSAKLWRITTQDGFRILKECDFHIHGYYTTLLNVHLCRKEE